MSNQNGIAIAIVGMAGKFPGAGDIYEFWKNLCNGTESIVSFSEEELLEYGIREHVLKDPNYIKANAFVKGKEFFDAEFFGYSESEAALMDPQMRMFHQCVWSALEDAAIDPVNTAEKIGLFAGGTTNLNWLNYSYLSNKEYQVNEFSASQLRDVSFLCSRISYSLNLQGPSIYINTACSTSLVAIQRATMSLLLKECSVAIAGGVTIHNYSKRGYLYEEGMIQSKDGHCRAFDASASGTVSGEGAGVVVLKKLSDAISDGDNIYAIIKGSGINNDGNDKIGYTAPSIDGQFQAIFKAINMAKVPAESIGMVEAHGTGTHLGDPVEVKALNLAFGKSDNHYCALGSVKTNIGHLDVASGVAGLIKAALSIKHRKIPASLHYKEANPEIDFRGSPFYVNTELRDWHSDLYPLRAGVSSFGIGGTNAHLILEEAPQLGRSDDSRSSEVLVFSAKSSAALGRNLDAFASYLDSEKVSDLGDIAYTLARGRSAFGFRHSVVCSSLDELREALVCSKSAVGSVIPVSASPDVIFMFTGQGSQYIQMYAGLYERERYFRELVDRCFDLVQLQSGLDLKSILLGSESTLITQTRYAQPLLFILEYSLARLLMSWGICPDNMIGHSIGEYVAACLSGVFSLEDCLLLVSKRGELMQGAPFGDMLSIGISERDLKGYLSQFPEICLAAHNSSSQCVVSGDHDAISVFQKTIESAGYSSRILHTSHAFHSHLMNGILEEFRVLLEKVMINKPELPFISNLTGDFVQPLTVSQAEYWVSHLREPVRFSEGISTLLSDKGAAIFVEVGPGNVLGTFVRSHSLRESSHHVISLVHGAQEAGDDLKFLLAGLGKLWNHGVDIDWDGFYKGWERRKVSLPTYSFEPTRYPVNVDAQELLLGLRSDIQEGHRRPLSEWFYSPSWKLLPISGVKERGMGAVLLLIDDDIVFEGLSRRYLESGAKVVRVRSGTAYCRESALSYQVSPAAANDYYTLFASLSSEGLDIDQLVHGWGIGGDKENVYTEYSCDRYFYSLLEAVKYWPSNDLSKDLVILTSDLHPVLDEGAVSGPRSLSLVLFKVLSQEYVGLSGRHIDISSDEISENLIFDNLYQQLKSGVHGSVISLRGGRVWEEIFVPLSSEGKYVSSVIREGGTYLITGGGGRLGSSLSSYLQEKYHANVVLLGRSESLGEDHDDSPYGQVLYMSCDISDQSAVETAVAIAEEKFGKIDGVIHGAGIVSGSSINVARELTAMEFQSQFNPKIKGVEVLDAVFGPRELDFCVLISSLSTVLGGLGFGAYGPANIYMDYYLKSQRDAGRLEQWISVDLDSLNFSGKTRDGINGEELGEVLEQSLHFLIHPRIVVSVGELDERYKRWVSSAPELLAEDTVEAEVEQGLKLSQETMLELWRHILGKPEMSVDDDFFDMGGDSLKVLTLIGRIHKQFNVEVTVKEFFNLSTVRRLDEYLGSYPQVSGQGGIGFTGIPRAERADYYPLSYAQRRLYFLNQFNKETLAYNMTQIVKLRGKVNKRKLSKAFSSLVLRHESLRTCFGIVDDQPVQWVMENLEPEIVYFEGGVDAERHMDEFVRPFDLSLAPLIRLGLIATDKDEHILMMDMHHIISDGVSKSILIRDFMALYNGEDLSGLALQYKDYAVWQQSEPQREHVRSQKEFWLAEFAEEVEVLELPTDFPRPLVKQYEGGHLRFELNELETSGLKKLAEKEGVTMFMLLFAVYSVMLSKLGNQEDMVIGVPIAGRDHAELEHILGMFVNMLPIRIRPQGSLAFNDFLAQVKEQALSCFENQSYPFEELIDELNIKRDTARNPMFETVFSFFNVESTVFSIGNLDIDAYEGENAISKFDLTLSALEETYKMKFDFEYSTVLFTKETIERFISYFRQVIISILNDITIKICSINMLSKKEALLLESFNQRASNYEKEKTISKIFEEKVIIKKDKIAVRIGKEVLTFHELNARSNKLARLILSKGVSKESIIGVLLPRSQEMIISLIAILKIGCAYVPIDPEYPIDRIKYMVEDSEISLLLIDGQFSEIYNQLNGRVEKILASSLELNNMDFSNVEINYSSSALAYLIYTSGSTGSPKGVMIEHRNVMNFIHGIDQRIIFPPSGVILGLTTYSFDIFVFEMFFPLLKGMEVVIASSSEQRDPDLLATLILERMVNVIQITPSHLKIFLSSPNFVRSLENIKVLMIGGEALSQELLEKIKKCYKGRIYNMYGPTETTIWSTIKDLTNTNIITIGSPIANTQIKIVDKYGAVQPINVPGELCIGGEGVARGYFGKQELTNEKFFYDSGNLNYRFYRTGDLARWLNDGDIAFVGRVDSQIKMNGFRIELKEIEYQLSSHKNIDNVIVLLKGNEANRFLIAYYISQKVIEPANLRDFLLKKLPNYMIPSFFIHLTTFPLTPNGKIDRKMFPDLEVNEAIENFQLDDEIEEKVLIAWQKVLNKTDLNLNIDFFEAGGSSLQLIILFKMLEQHYPGQIKVMDMFENNTIRAMANYIRTNNEELAPNKEKIQKISF